MGARERLEMGGEKGPVGTSVHARMCAEGVGGRDVGNDWGEGPMGMSERGCADVFCRRCGCKGKVKWVGKRSGMSVDAQKCADSLGARKKLEMGGEKGRWA